MKKENIMFNEFRTGLYGTQLNNLHFDAENITARQYFLEIANKNKFGYVYIIKGTHKGFESYIIGKADSLLDRLKRFEVKIPFDIELVMSFYVSNPLNLESYFHTKFAHKRQAGEWFDLNKVDLAKIMKDGLIRESDDMNIAIQKDINNLKKTRYENDKEYIEYLETILIMNNIKFIARGI